MRKINVDLSGKIVGYDVEMKKENVSFVSVDFDNSFIKPKYDFDLKLLVESASLEEIKSFKKREILKQYSMHKINGVEFYNDFRTILLIDVDLGNITESQALDFSNLLLPTLLLLTNGDWKSCHTLLNDIESTNETFLDYLNYLIESVNNYINTLY